MNATGVYRFVVCDFRGDMELHEMGQQDLRAGRSTIVREHKQIALFQSRMAVVVPGVIEIWDLKKRRRMLVRSDIHTPSSCISHYVKQHDASHVTKYQSLTFVTEEIIAAPNCQEGTIDLWQARERNSTYSVVCRLAMPRLHPEIVPTTFTCTSLDSAATWSSGGQAITFNLSLSGNMLQLFDGRASFVIKRSSIMMVLSNYINSHLIDGRNRNSSDSLIPWIKWQRHAWTMDSTGCRESATIGSSFTCQMVNTDSTLLLANINKAVDIDFIHSFTNAKNPQTCDHPEMTRTLYIYKADASDPNCGRTRTAQHVQVEASLDDGSRVEGFAERIPTVDLPLVCKAPLPCHEAVVADNRLVFVLKVSVPDQYFVTLLTAV
jgi:hypothetical protein